MRALNIGTAVNVRKTIISTTLAAATLLVGCAMERTPGFGAAAPQAPDCRMNSVLYCDLTPQVERCQCVRGSHVRNILRTAPRP